MFNIFLRPMHNCCVGETVPQLILHVIMPGLVLDRTLNLEVTQIEISQVWNMTWITRNPNSAPKSLQDLSKILVGL